MLLKSDKINHIIVQNKITCPHNAHILYHTGKPVAGLEYFYILQNVVITVSN